MVFYSSDGSDRGKRTENIASIGLCCVAIAGFLCLVWALGSLSGKQAEQRRSQPHLHAMAAKDEALARCASKSAGMLTECLYDAIEASEATSRTEQDLTAQQRAAWAAAFAAFFAFISLPISIGGLWALLRSLKHTEQAIAVSVNAIDETRKANIQARKQAKAVLYTTDCYFDFMHDQSAQHMDCRVILNVENVGDTPAQRVVFKVGVHFLNKRKRLAVGSKNHFIGIVRARSNENAEMKFTIRDRAVLDQNIKKFNRVLITLERTFMDVFDDRSEEKYALISPVSKREDGLFAANDFTFCDRNFVSVIKNVPLRRAS